MSKYLNNCLIQRLYYYIRIWSTIIIQERTSCYIQCYFNASTTLLFLLFKYASISLLWLFINPNPSRLISKYIKYKHNKLSYFGMSKTKTSENRGRTKTFGRYINHVESLYQYKRTKNKTKQNKTRFTD